MLFKTLGGLSSNTNTHAPTFASTATLGCHNENTCSELVATGTRKKDVLTGVNPTLLHQFRDLRHSHAQ